MADDYQDYGLNDPTSSTQVQSTKVGANDVATGMEGKATSWDPNQFQSVVGRAPSQQESDYYSKAGSGWLDEVKSNTPGTPGYSAAPSGQAPAPAPAGGGATENPGTTGNLSDPAYVSKLIAYYAAQPGADPSLKNDPNYWSQKMLSGTFGSDPNYAVHKMVNGWKEAPGGGFGSLSGQFSSGSGNSWSNAPLPSQMGTPWMPTAAAQSPYLQQFYNQLLGRSQQSLNVNANDPVIKGQVDQFRNAQTRGQRSNLAAVAEAAGPNSNLTAETRHAGEAVGQNTAGFQAGLMQQEVTARRQEIAQALQLQGQHLSLQEQSRLREEDQALQARSLQLGGQMNDAQIALANSQGALGAGNQAWMQAFQDRGWNADQAQRAWQDQYQTVYGQ